ncbi:MAG: 4Fe-4S dicluster domain-containing protein, partial [Bacteroidales bacterium]|nr:4Fe-4S dicluster domain-containing protein [Bacteroidales bacterium]
GSKIRKQIEDEFPDKRLKRRNTGYAVDLMLDMEPFSENGENFNLSRLLCGSEGTLAFTTEVKLNLVDLPPKEKGLLVVHHYSLQESFYANLVALDFEPVAIELIDKYILDCTKTSLQHKENRFFIKDDPIALLCVEFAGESREEVNQKCEQLIGKLKEKEMGYHYSVLYGNDISKVWGLRKAGLGLLSNVPGDAKPQPVIEDTAVLPEYLPEYIKEFDQSLEKRGLSCVYYAHIATGELHLRPVINLKTREGVAQFRGIATDIASIVKKYKGSLSGEHGDGRLRGEFIKTMVGEDNYQLMIDLKTAFDPGGIFNQGKITDTPPMDTFLRNIPGKETRNFDTILDFSDSLGMVRLAEKCNGSADCRKSHIIGGTMCPTFQATRDEDKTTRARANMLREILVNENQEDVFSNKDLYQVLDLCISCKGCKRECPSGVDMAKLKAEFLYQFHKKNGVKLRTWLIAYFTQIQSIASKFSVIYNAVVKSKITSGLVKKILRFAPERSLPKVHRISFRKWAKKYLRKTKCDSPLKTVVFFIDEFTNFNDVNIGKAAIQLLDSLGYKIEIVNHKESGRTFISKGLLAKAKNIASLNVNQFSELISDDIPLIGIEPSAVLTFRDEYIDLLRGKIKEKAIRLSKNVFTVEEFLANEITSQHIDENLFVSDQKNILYHGHCQQKALNGTSKTMKMLSLPKNYSVEEIASGCCGMAGSFGYEKEHYDLSISIAELVLLPKVREAKSDTIICASGTSCRHQIKDGTGKSAKHPIEVMWEALKEKN